MSEAVRPDYEIRTVTEAELAVAVDWAAAEGWNPGLADAGCFTAADPNGFFGGFVDGRMIASLSVVNYGGDYSHIGFYIVVPEERGNGYGYALWQRALEHAGDRLAGLDGVVAEQDAYRASGFALAHRSIRHGGRLAAAPVAPTPGVEIRSPDSVTEGLSRFDRRCFPASRDVFLRAWLAAPGHVARIAVRDAAVVGCGVVRRCRVGWKVGPLFADDRAVAEALVGALALETAGDEVFIDVPETSDDAMALVRDLGLTPAFETARMYRGPAPAIDGNRVFGLTTLELG